MQEFKSKIVEDEDETPKSCFARAFLYFSKLATDI